jgi:alkylhydroperoxidase family enzyme
LAHLPYVNADELSERPRRALEALPELNIFRMLAHAETAFVPVVRLGGAILTEQQLDPKLRELTILQVARLTPAEYEWVQHVPIAKGVGASDAEVGAIERGELEDEALGEDERLVLRFTTDVVTDARPSEATLEAVKGRFPPREIVELLLTIGYYMALARVMETTGLDLDEPAGMQVVDGARRAADR